MMNQVKLERDEAYPVVVLDSEYGDEYDIPETLLANFRAAAERYHLYHGEILRRMHEQDAARR
jgi:hypothetical protein